MKILLIDDHPIVRAGLRSLLEEETSLDIVSFLEASSVPEAMSSLRTSIPDLAIVDIGLAGGDGLEWIKDVRAMGHDFPALVMSMFDERLYAERVLQAGGNGYLMKRELAEHLVEAIQVVLSGEIYLSKVMKQVVKFRSDGQRSAVEQLSDRELEVFRMIGDGMTTKEIGASLGLSVKTIETYRSNIKTKLELRNAAELASTASRWIEAALTS